MSFNILTSAINLIYIMDLYFIRLINDFNIFDILKLSTLFNFDDFKNIHYTNLFQYNILIIIYILKTDKCCYE